MKTPSFICYFAVISCFLAMMVSCTDYAEDLRIQRKYQEAISQKRVTVTLHIEDSFSILSELIETESESLNKSVSTSRSDNWKLHYYVAVYNDTLRKSPRIYSSSDSVMDIHVKSGDYRLVAWADRRASDESYSHYYHTDDFSEMLLRNKYNYEAQDSLKVPYHAISDMNVGYEPTHSFDMKLTPAMGRFRLMSDDIPDYPVGKVLVTYLSAIPAAIDARSGNISWLWNDISFTTLPKVNVVASDALFARNDTKSIVSLKLEVYDTSGNIRARRVNVSFPLVNGKTTIVRSDFFSILEDDDNPQPPPPNDGGLAIDTRFSGDYNVIFN